MAVAFSFASMFAYSQNQPAYSTVHGWVVSKDVQRFSNKDLLTRKTGLNIKSIDRPDVISKGVQAIGKSVTTEKGNVVSQGYPVWIISKEVQKIGRIN